MKTGAYVSPIAILLCAGAAFTPVESCAQEKWTESIDFYGDIRPRFEAVHEEGEEDRQRGRFRVRVGVKANFTDSVEAVFQLASGGDNPVSTNQSFEDGFSTEDVRIDLAYIDWSPKDSLHVYVGRMKNPLIRSGGHALVWDSDLNPKGVALKYKKGMFFGTFGGSSAEERSTSGDSYLLALEGGVNFDVTESTSLIAGVGYFDYSKTKGYPPFYDTKPRGNSADAQGNLLFDYRVFEVFAQLDTKIGDMPLMIFADFVQNTRVGINDTGYAIGGQIGKASAPGQWQGSIAYQDLGADALIATFTDSDFGGGGTDATGFTLKTRYVFADSWSIAGTLFLNEVEENIGNKHDYTRLQLDLEFKF